MLEKEERGLEWRLGRNYFLWGFELQRISPAVTDLELVLNTFENTFEFTSFPDHQHSEHMSDIDPPCAEILTVTFKQQDQSSTKTLLNLFTTIFPDELFNSNPKKKILTQWLQDDIALCSQFLCDPQAEIKSCSINLMLFKKPRV